MNNLEWLIESFPDKTSAQRRMMVNGLLPGLLKDFDADPAP
jgi:hypothetical protein